MRVLGLLAVLLWGGCNLIFPFDVRTAGDGSPADSDGGSADGNTLRDLTGLVLGPEYTHPLQVRVGQHVALALALGGVTGDVKVGVTSDHCLLVLPGKGDAPARKLTAVVTSPGKLQLAVFAPITAPAPGSCKVSFTVGSTTVTVTASVEPPQYTLLFLQSDPVQGMKGLQITHLGDLQHSGQIQGLIRAGGSFNEDFVVGLAKPSSSTPTSPSTVRIYRFKSKVAAAAPLQPVLDLYGENKNPTVLDDLVWSDAGLCQPDAVYLAANYGDATYSSDTVQGSITCMDSTNTIVQQALNDNARAVGVVPTDGFFANAVLGSVLYSSDSTTYLHPGSHAVDAISAGTDQLVFAASGSYKGHLYAVKHGSNNPLVRISPPPGQTVTPLRDLVHSEIRIALSTGGAFGQVVLTAERGTSAVQYHLLALVEEQTTVRAVTLLQDVTCGIHFAVAPAGNHVVLLAPPASAGCNGPWSIYRLEFELP